MKKIILSAAFFAAILSVQGQKEKTVSAYNELRSVYKYLNKDKMSEALMTLNEAKTLIDESSAFESTMHDPKTLYYKIKIYQTLMQLYPQSKENAEVAKLVNDDNIQQLAETSGKAFEDLKKYDEKKEYLDRLKGEFKQQYNKSLNQGSTFYNEGNYLNAYGVFAQLYQASAQFDELDTTAAFNASLAAEKLEQWNNVANFAQICVDANYSQLVYSYQSLLTAYVNLGDEEKALAVAADATNKFPDNVYFLTNQIDLLLKADKYDEAEKLVALAIEKEPNNANLIYNAGVIYNTLNKPEMAVEMFKKAAELDPENVQMVLVIGHFFRNQGVEAQEAANMLPEDQVDEYNKLKDDAKKFYKESIPFYEKALALDPENTKIMMSLKQVYGALNMVDEYKAMKAKLGQ